MPGLQIRKYRPSDLRSLYRVCLYTGNRGKGAQDLYVNQELLGAYYAAPYAVLHPELTFVLANDEDVVGYVLGTHDSEHFAKRCEAEWFPQIRATLGPPESSDGSPDAEMIRRILTGHERDNRYPDYPAHLHIDILPQGRGLGWGRKLLDTFITRLRSDEVPGVHLGVGRGNENAVGFYRHYGFQLLEEQADVLYFGYKLSKGVT